MKYDSKQSRPKVVKEPGEQLTLGFAPTAVSIGDVMAPTGYKGLSAFHKYWGKKPIECLGFLVEKLTHPHSNRNVPRCTKHYVLLFLCTRVGCVAVSYLDSSAIRCSVMWQKRSTEKYFAAVGYIFSWLVCFCNILSFISVRMKIIFNFLVSDEISVEWALER